jgi:N-acetylglucosaminyldiphosphoundecaprenol N-acetyl-beta-D-mannosaminyltransferase
MPEDGSIERLEALPTSSILGVPVHGLRPDEAVELCREAAITRTRLMIGVVNAAKIVKMRSDRMLRDSVLNSDLILADGMSVVWASRILGCALPERVTGIDLFERLLGAAEEDRLSVYFLGASQEVLDGVLARARMEHPELRIAGSRNGYFTTEEEKEVAGEISRAAPDLLFVGISTPKKEIFLESWGKKIEVCVCHGVGGSFDVYSGKTRRAPIRWQHLGIEWLYRVLQEPRRMWRRYLVTNSAFILLVLTEWIRRIRHP